LVLVCAAPGLLRARLERAHSKGWKARFAALPAWLSLITAAFIIWRLSNLFGPPLQFRLLPLMLFGTLGLGVLRIFPSREELEAFDTTWPFLLSPPLMLARNPFNCGAPLYVFYMIFPALCAYHIIMFKTVPAWLGLPAKDSARRYEYPVLMAFL